MERFTFADARLQPLTQDSNPNFHFETRNIVSSSEHSRHKSYLPHLYVSTVSPFLTSHRTSTLSSRSHSSNSVPYIPLSSTSPLKDTVVNNAAYNRIVNSNEVDVVFPDTPDILISPTNVLLESLIKSYMMNKNKTLVQPKSTTEPSPLLFLSSSFDEEENGVIRSKVKREDVQGTKVRALKQKNQNITLNISIN